MRAVAPQILNKNIRCIGLRGEAIVPDVNLRVGHRQPLDIICVEAVGIFWERLQLLVSPGSLYHVIPENGGKKGTPEPKERDAYRSIRRERVYAYTVEIDLICANEKGIPAR